jgi:hypothetical protein
MNETQKIYSVFIIIYKYHVITQLLYFSLERMFFSTLLFFNLSKYEIKNPMCFHLGLTMQHIIYTSDHPHCFNLTSDNIYLVCVTVTLFLWQHNWFDICGLQIEGNAKPRGDMLNLTFLEMIHRLDKYCPMSDWNSEDDQRYKLYVALLNLNGNT